MLPLGEQHPCREDLRHGPRAGAVVLLDPAQGIEAALGREEVPGQELQAAVPAPHDGDSLDGSRRGDGLQTRQDAGELLEGRAGVPAGVQHKRLPESQMLDDLGEARQYAPIARLAEQLLASHRGRSTHSTARRGRCR